MENNSEDLDSSEVVLEYEEKELVEFKTLDVRRSICERRPPM